MSMFMDICIYVCDICVCYQVKFSEITLDMFRMLQAVEYEPQEEILEQRQTDASIILSSPRPPPPSTQNKV